MKVFGVEGSYLVDWVVWVNGVVVCEFDFYDMFLVVDYLYLVDNIFLLVVVV